MIIEDEREDPDDFNYHQDRNGIRVLQPKDYELGRQRFDDGTSPGYPPLAVEGARRRSLLHEIQKVSAPCWEGGGVVEAALAVPCVEAASAAPCCGWVAAAREGAGPRAARW
jgi:hypothetical protein